MFNIPNDLLQFQSLSVFQLATDTGTGLVSIKQIDFEPLIVNNSSKQRDDGSPRVPQHTNFTRPELADYYYH